MVFLVFPGYQLISCHFESLMQPIGFGTQHWIIYTQNNMGVWSHVVWILFLFLPLEIWTVYVKCAMVQLVFIRGNWMIYLHFQVQAHILVTGMLTFNFYYILHLMGRIRNGSKYIGSQSILCRNYFQKHYLWMDILLINASCAFHLKLT